MRSQPVFLCYLTVSSFTIMAACVGILGTQTGCVGLMANLVHAVGADKIPANYDGLKKSRVAIVTISDNSQYSDDLAARQLSRSVGEILLKEVDKLTLVREDEIEQWRDTNGRDNIDLLSIGQGVKADKVIGIELTNMRLREGKTLYQGRSDVSVSVIEVSHGGVVHTKQWEDFTYPVSSGQYTSETTEMKFQKLYLSILAKQIAREFYPYDMSETVALDAAIASQ